MADAGEVTELATGLRFPEGPVAMPDGSVLVCEIAAGRITRVRPDGTTETAAETGGGPNGAAIGPDGKLYVCNNGGVFKWEERFGMLVPGGPPPTEWSGGCIQRVDLDSGAVEVLYTESSSGPLRAPNDLVFDAHGGFWFTDHGARLARSSDRTGIHYASADGSRCTEVIFPLDAPNGIGLSPDGSQLYAAETHTCRLWAWDVTAPGEIAATDPLGPGGGRLMVGLAGLQLFDSLAVDGEAWVNVATLVNGGITSVSPDAATVEHTPLPDLLVTNICFGGADNRTAFCTLSGTGKLVSVMWPRPGLPLAS
jgi:gluconolactonase